MKQAMIFLVIALVFMTAPAIADVPHLINYQGYLTDTGSEALDTTVAMTFSLYDAATLGTQLWTETQPACTVREGLFNVILGSVNAIPDSTFDDTLVWLGITVGADSEMDPRTQVVSVAYAYRVGTVDGASGGNITGKLNVGDSNSNAGNYAFVVGADNHATGDNSTIGGGEENTATASYSVVAGGAGNNASGGFSTIGGGEMNSTPASYLNVSGGRGNRATDDYATVGGGRLNRADSAGAFVGGGAYNTATNDASAIGGGSNNLSSGAFSTIGGGGYNRTRGDYSVIAGGGGESEADSNSASGTKSFIGGGSGNTATRTLAIVVGGTTNNSKGYGSFVGGGRGNNATSNYSVVSGGRYNYARGQYSVVAGGGGASLSDSNSARGYYSAIGGGRNNEAIGNSSTVSGGRYNKARGDYSVVAGGGGPAAEDSNSASWDYSVIGGGRNNEARAACATVGGGVNNSVTGTYATIPGGYGNVAVGQYSFAAGRRAFAAHDGAFVWADATDDQFTSPEPNLFYVRSSRGVRMYTNAEASIGVALSPSDNTWNSICDSTTKTNIRLVDTGKMLDKVAQLPIKRWTFKDGDPDIEHISPMAQDFWNLFHVGSDSLKISTLDPAGIALAAIQELKVRTDEIEILKSENEAIRTRLDKLETLLQSLLASLHQNEIEQATVVNKNINQ